MPKAIVFARPKAGSRGNDRIDLLCVRTGNVTLARGDLDGAIAQLNAQTQFENASGLDLSIPDRTALESFLARASQRLAH